MKQNTPRVTRDFDNTYTLPGNRKPREVAAKYRLAPFPAAANSSKSPGGSDPDKARERYCPKSRPAASRFQSTGSESGHVCHLEHPQTFALSKTAFFAITKGTEALAHITTRTAVNIGHFEL